MTQKFIKHPLIKEKTVEARLYQQLVYAKAVKGHTLFVAPTALGKTVLCVMVAAHRLRNVGGQVLMLAPTRPLVLQHTRSLRKFLNLPKDQILDFSGGISPSERESLWPLAKVAAATPQVVENDLREGRLNLAPYSLVVFDEAHRAVGNYAYVSIAKAYLTTGRHPLILGLTASPGNREEVIREVCENLGIVHIEVRTDDDTDVKPYVNPVEIDWRFVSLPAPLVRASQLLREYIEERYRSLKSLGLVKSDYPTRKDLLEVGRLLGLGEEAFSSMGKPSFMYYKSLMDYATALKAEHALELLETQGVLQTLRYLERMEHDYAEKKSPRSTRSFLRDSRICQLMDSLRRLHSRGIEHPKVDHVVSTVSAELSKRPGAGFIVFTNFRDTVDILVDRLSQIEGVRVTRFVGQSSRRGRGLSQREQTQILDLFRKGSYNVLVATSVAEEGLDIAEVGMVLFYDCTPSAIRNIQRRGRTGRKGAGKVVILMTEKTREEAYHWAGQSRERRMKELLKRLDTDLKKRQLKLDGFVKGARSSA